MVETYIGAVVTPPEGGGRDGRSAHLSHRLSGRLSHRLSGGVSLYPLTALALAACGGGGGGGSPIPEPDPEPTPTPTPTEPLTGRVFDGPVVGAQVYFDVNENGVQDAGDVPIGETDARGQFTISGEDLDKYGADTPLLVVLDGATDIGDDLDDPSDDREIDSGTWQAPADSSIISPLTDLLVRAEIDSDALAELLELPSDVDVTQYDPYDADTPDETALAVIEVAQEVAEILVDLDATDEEVTPDEIATVVERVVTSESPTEFTLNPVVTTLAEDADTGTRTQVATLAVTDADTESDAQTYLLSGDDKSLFEVDGATLYLRAGAAVDYERALELGGPSLDVTVKVVGTELTQTYTLAVTDVDDNAPTAIVFANVVDSLAENTATAMKLADITITDADGGNNAVTIPDSDIFELNSDGTELWLQAGAVLDYETASEHTITLQATTDGVDVDGVTQTFTLAVTDVDDNAPTAIVFANAVNSLAENTATAMKLADITLTDADVGNNGVTIVGTSTIFEIRNGNQLWLQAGAGLDFETATEHTIMLQATTDGVAVAPSVETPFTLAVTNVASAPVLTASGSQTLTLEEGTTNPAAATGFSFAATDEDNDTVTFTVDDARFEITPGGVLNVKANQTFDYETEPSITLTITATDDSTGTLTDTETVTITITNVASAPVLTASGSQTLTLEEGTTNPAAATGFSFAATDEDNDTVTLSVSDNRFEIIGGVLNVKANQTFDFETEPSITLTITATDDSTGTLTDTETVTITITNVASAPVLTASGSQTLTLNEGTTNPAAATGFSFTATDEDNDTVTLSVDDARFEIIGGVLNVKANQTFDFETEPSITLTITGTDDSTGTLTDTETVTITITDAAEAPVISVTGTQGTLEEGTVAAETATGLTVTATDDDGDDVTFAVTGDSENRFAIADDGTLNIVAGSVFDFETQNPITLTITATDDSTGTLTDTETVTITITNVASAPVFTGTGSQTFTPVEGTVAAETATGYVFTATDEDGDTVTFSVNDARFTIDADGTLNIVAGSVFDFEAAANPSGVIRLTITATDDSTGTLTTTQTVDFSFTDVASDPTITVVSNTQTLTLNEGTANLAGATGYSFTAMDEGGNSLTLSVDDDRFEITTGGVLNVKAGQVFDFEDTANPSGVIRLTITATDAGGRVASQTAEITLTNVASAPVLTASGSQTLTLEEGTTNPAEATGFSFTATDEDGDTVTLSVDDNRFEITTGGVLNVKANQTFDFETEPSITLTITATDDSTGTLTDTETVTITITNVASAPVLTASGSQTLTLEEGTTNPAAATGYSFAATDEDNDTVTLSVDDDRFEITTGDVLSVKANQTFDFETEPSITLTITGTDDSTGTLTDTETVTITITNVASAPVLTASGSQTLTLEEGTTNPAAATGYSFTATDEDNDTVTLSVDDARFEIIGGVLNVKASQTFDYETEETITLTITATAGGQIDTETVTITITNVASAPVLTASGSQTLTLNEGTTNPAAATGYSFTATDEDNDGVTLSVDDNRFEIIGGVLNVKASQTFDFETEPSITLTITGTDDSTGTLTDTEVVTITITNVASAPVLTASGSQTLTLEEGTTNPLAATGYSFTATDEDGDTVTLSVDDARFEITTGGVLNVIANQTFDFETEPSITLTITATAGGQIDTETVTITITDVPSAPVLMASGLQTLTLEEGTTNPAAATGFSFAATDEDGDTVTLLVDDARFEITPGGVLNVKANQTFDFETESSITLTITATAGGQTDTETVTITITNVASAPVLTASGSQTLTLNEGTTNPAEATGFSFTATDEDNDTVTLSISDDRFEITPGGVLNVKASQTFDYETEETITLTITATAGGQIDTETVTITITNVASAPVLTASGSQTLTLNEGTTNPAAATGYSFTATDEDGDTVTLSVDDARFEITTGGVLSVKANQVFDFETQNPITLTITATDDSTGTLSSTQTVTITITDVDDAPTAFVLMPLPFVSIDEGSTAPLTKVADLTVTDADTDSADQVYALSGADADLFVVIGSELFIKAGAIIDYETIAARSAPDNVTLNVTVAVAGTSLPTQSVSVAVTDVTSDPTITVGGSQTLTLEEGIVETETATGLAISVTAGATLSLSDSDALRFRIADDGRLLIRAGSEFDISSPANPSGTITLTVTAIDDTSGLVTKQDVAIQMTAVANSVLALFSADVGLYSAPVFGDVDGDGDMDVLVGDETGISNFFRWGESDGTGTGWSDQTATMDSDNNFINPFRRNDVGDDSTPAFGDVDGDGDMDLVVGEHLGNLNFFRWGTNADTADSPGTGWTYQTGANDPLSAFNVGTDAAPAFGDVDGDGDMDLLVGAGDGYLYFYRWGTNADTADSPGTGWTNGNLSLDGNPPLQALWDFVGSFDTAPAFGDVDGDGDMDLLVGGRDGRLHFIRWGLLSDGTTPGWTEVTGDDNPFDGVDVGFNSTPTFGDVDGDGDDDLLVGEWLGNLNIWYWDDSTNTWVTFTDAIPAPTLTGTQNMLTEGPGFGSYTPTGLTVSAPYFTPGARTFIIDDDRFVVDADGNLNIVAGSQFNYEDAANPGGVITLTISSQDSDGQVGLPLEVTLQITDVDEAPTEVSALFSADVGTRSAPTFGDVDGDGDDDLLVGRGDGFFDFFRWGEDDGTGRGWTAVTGSDNPFSSFGVGSLSPVHYSDAAPTFVDVDGDGDMDLHAGGRDGRLNFFRWGEDDGTGTGWAKGSAPSPLLANLGGGYSTPATGDYDGDGDLDVLAGNGNGGFLFFRWGDGSGTPVSSPSQASWSVFGPYALFNGVFDSNVAPAFGDVDGDGDDDLLIGELDGTLYFFRWGEADGTGTFWSEQNAALTGNLALLATDFGDYSKPAFGDVDGDGDDDLIIGDEDGTFTILYWNGSTNAWAYTTDVIPAPALTPGTQNRLEEGILHSVDTGLRFDASGITSFSVDDTRFNISNAGVLFTQPYAMFDYEDVNNPSGVITLMISAVGTGGLVGAPLEVTLQITNVEVGVSALTSANVSDRSNPAFGDVDGDGDLDVLIGDTRGTLNFFRWGDGSGTEGSTGWGDQASTLPDSLSVDVGLYSAPAFGDVDGDGDMDLLVGEQDGTLHFFRRGTANDGAAADSDKSWSEQTGVGNNPFDVADPNAWPPQTFDVGWYSSPAFGDVDGDGDMDLLVGNNTGNLNFYRWGESDGTGTGWSVQTGSNNPFSGTAFDEGQFAKPTFGDVDGDGDMDVLVGEQDGILHFFRRGTANDGTAEDSTKSWSDQTNTMDGDDNRINPFHGVDVGDRSAPTFGDADADGDLDLIVGEHGGNLNIWYWDATTDTWSTTTDVI